MLPCFRLALEDVRKASLLKPHDRYLSEEYKLINVRATDYPHFLSDSKS